MSRSNVNGTFQVRAIYDFQAQPCSGEIDISAGEVLRVTDKNIGEGWWQGVNSRGEWGIFPAGYVEIIDNHSNNPISPPAPSYPPPPGPIDYDNFDDDWDDDDDSQTSASVADSARTGTNFSNVIHVAPKAQVPPRKSIKFVRISGEDFLLDSKPRNPPSNIYFYIVTTGDGEIMWSPNPNIYQCTITETRKQSKLKGLKSYMAYQLNPSFDSTISVSRRYKHFDWLYGRLDEKFLTIPIPALPCKQISGRFETEFIEQRRIQLQMWVSRICKHPVISQCDVWKHFIECSAFGKKWKDGKRKAEKDEYTGASFFYTIQAPSVPLGVSFVETKTESFGRFVLKMDEAVKCLTNVSQDQCKKHQGPYKKEMQNISAAFNLLATSFAQTDVTDNSLNEALRHTADTYESISKMFEKEPQFSYEPLTYSLHMYRGLLASWPDILNFNKGIMNKKKEYIKLKDEGKIDESTAELVSQRADVVAYATLAEINYFQKERLQDYRKMMQNFLQAQINFYESFVSKLRQAIEFYN